jgi:hypothetical protein
MKDSETGGSVSKSRRKTPIFGNAVAESEKKDKRIWNKKFRRLSRQKIRRLQEPPSDIREVTQVWLGEKDGKHYWAGASERDMGK